MDRVREVSPYGRFLLLALVTMAIIFAVAYPITISREGYLYNDQILVPGTENGNTTYSATVNGKLWCFTVTPDKVVTFRYGDKEYGPYRAKKDSSAIPAGHDLERYMTGVELRCGDEILFRGGIYDTGSMWLMYNEDGTDATFSVAVMRNDGTMVDGDGNIVDRMEPGAGTILKMMEGPELTHKGHGGFWFLGVFISLFVAALILFADELFRWRYRFRIRNLEDIEPSELEISVRPLTWTLWVGLVLYMYILGLQ